MNAALPTHRQRQAAHRLHHVRHTAVQAWLKLMVLFVLGCGQEAAPATVEGTLRLHDKPLDHCLITFLPEPGQEEPRPHSTAVTDQQGHYRLRLADQREGASVGWHRVTVQDLSVSTGVRRRDHGTVDQQVDETEPPPVRRSRVPESYSSPATTPLEEEIKPGSQVIDLEIR